MARSDYARVLAMADEWRQRALDTEYVESLSAEQRARMAKILEGLAYKIRQGLFYRYFPDETFEHDGFRHWARDLYPRHLEHFRAGSTYKERCFLAANRIGKTDAGGYELAAHLTGDYPDWWEGRRFPGPVEAWVAGDTNETVRDILMPKLLGRVTTSDDGRRTVDGTGMIPGDHIAGPPTWRQGVSELIDTIRVRHIKGGESVLGLKSYQQGRLAFQGTAKHVVWLDEEVPADIYGECLMRTMTTQGIMILTFTPLKGLSELVLEFLPGHRPGKAA